MSEINVIGQERLKYMGKLVNEMYDRLVASVIADIKSLPETHREQYVDSKFKDVWEEYKYQVQREQSFFFTLYEDTVGGLCNFQIENLDREVKGILWLWSNTYYDWNSEEYPDIWDVVLDEDITKELHDRVRAFAGDEEWVIDPDEARDRERFEDDLRPYRKKD